MCNLILTLSSLITSRLRLRDAKLSGDVAAEARWRRKEVAFRKVCLLDRTLLCFLYCSVCVGYSSFQLCRE